MHAPDPLFQSALIAAADPARVLWAGGLLTLVIVGISVIFVGWVLARWMRLRYQRVIARARAESDLGDAWSEAAKRIGPNDHDDPDLPPDAGPPSGPHAQWQS